MYAYIKRNKYNMKLYLTIAGIFIHAAVFSQADRWQQHANYKMDVAVDAINNKFNGKQPFQPGSMMDERSQHLGKKSVTGRPDWDQRVKDRIANLQPHEIGYQKVSNLKVNGVLQKTTEYETILKVELSKPILPKSKALIELEFEAQVPVQIRRSGRDNAEGVRFSMAQWYPKLCEYDRSGWHPTPYVAREFYGVWGDFEVNIKIDSAYTIAATGYLQNSQEIGHGYQSSTLPFKPSKEKMLTWKFKAPNVHDFVWAADPAYIHKSKQIRKGLVLHSFYKIDETLLGKQYDAMPPRMKERMTKNDFINNYRMEWENVLDFAAKAVPYMDSHYGEYPYKQYSFIQGGDGGMEYGEVFLEQLGYIVGANVRDSILIHYFNTWKFKHPDAIDFIRVAEKTSGLQLDWYKDFFVNTNKTIDYAIDSLWEVNGKMQIRFKNNGTMPMPLDVELTFKDGSKEMAYIPQYLMFGEKQNETPSVKRTVGQPWKWTHPTYTITVDRKLFDLKKAEIDPLQRMADTERKNNVLVLNW